MSFPESCGLSDFLASLDGGLAAGDLGRLGLLGLIDGLGAEVLLDGAEQHDEADAADDAEHDLETEDARVGIDALGVDEAAVPGVDEHVGHEADHGQHAGGRAEDAHGDLDLRERRASDGEGAVGGEPEHDDQDGGDHGRARIMREDDEAEQHRDGQDEGAQDDLGGALQLRGQPTDHRAGDEADAVGADEAHDVHEIAVGVEAVAAAAVGDRLLAAPQVVHAPEGAGNALARGVEADLAVHVDVQRILRRADGGAERLLLVEQVQKETGNVRDLLVILRFRHGGNGLVLRLGHDLAAQVGVFDLRDVGVTVEDALRFVQKGLELVLIAECFFQIHRVVTSVFQVVF